MIRLIRTSDSWRAITCRCVTMLWSICAFATIGTEVILGDMLLPFRIHLEGPILTPMRHFFYNTQFAILLYLLEFPTPTLYVLLFAVVSIASLVMFVAGRRSQHEWSSFRTLRRPRIALYAQAFVAFAAIYPFYAHLRVRPIRTIIGWLPTVSLVLSFWLIAEIAIQAVRSPSWVHFVILPFTLLLAQIAFMAAFWLL